MKKIIILALILAPMTIFAQKFGHFNSAEIIQALPDYKTAQTEIQNLGQQYQKELQTMQEELQRKYDAYMTQKDSLPQNVQQRRQEEIQQLSQRFQETQNTYQQELEKAEGEKMQSIQQKILGAVKQIGEAGGYVYIMDMAGGVPFISATLSTDITADLKSKLGIK